MTKLSFINNNPDDRRITIRTASKESKITPLAEVLNSYTLCPERVGFCLGPYVKPIEPPTIEIKDVSLFDGFVTDRLDIELVSNYSTLPAGWTIEPVFKVTGEQPITDQFSYDAKSPFLLQGIELVKAAVNTTFSVAFKLLNKGKLVMTTEYKSFTIATGRARIQYTAPMKIVEGQEIITVTGRITLGKRGNPVKFTFTDTTDPTSNKKIEYDAVVNAAGQFSFKIDLSSFLDGNIFIATTGVGIDNAVITGPYQTIDNFFPLVVKVLGGRNLRVSTAANGVLNIPNRVTWGDNRAGPLATGHMVHTYTTAASTVHELQIRRNTGPLVVVELAECTLDSNYTKVETSAITEIVNFGKAVLGIKFFKAIAFTKVPEYLPPHMTNLDDTFNGAKTFNSPSLVKWNLKNVTTANRMLKDSIFNQNLSKSCVSNLKSEPTEFSAGAPLTSANKPVWGTCPV